MVIRGREPTDNRQGLHMTDYAEWACFIVLRIGLADLSTSCQALILLLLNSLTIKSFKHTIDERELERTNSASSGDRWCEQRVITPGNVRTKRWYVGQAVLI